MRKLHLAELLSVLHPRTTHHLSASECPTLTLPQLLANADADDAARWEAREFAYTDPHGAPWFRQTIDAVFTLSLRRTTPAAAHAL